MAEAQLTEVQLEARSKGIGSSDAAAAVGMSRWTTQVELWLEKTGRVERPDIGDKEFVHFGNILEDVIAKEYSRRSGNKVRRKKTPYVRQVGILPMVANIDRLITLSGSPILECKNTSAYMSGEWSDHPPEDYRIQVEHQLITAEKHDAVIAALVGGNTYVEFELERHDGMSEFLVAKETEFWQHVLDDTHPQPISAADVVALFPVDTGQVVIASPELEEIHEELMSIRGTLGRLTKQKKELVEQMQMEMKEGESEIMLSGAGQIIATWKTGKGSAFCHWEDIAGELAAAYRTAGIDQRVGEEADLFIEQIILAHSGTYPHGNRTFLPKKIKEQQI